MCIYIRQTSPLTTYCIWRYVFIIGFSSKVWIHNLNVRCDGSSKKIIDLLFYTDKTIYPYICSFERDIVLRPIYIYIKIKTTANNRISTFQETNWQTNCYRQIGRRWQLRDYLYLSKKVISPIIVGSEFVVQCKIYRTCKLYWGTPMVSLNCVHW